LAISAAWPKRRRGTRSISSAPMGRMSMVSPSSWRQSAPCRPAHRRLHSRRSKDLIISGGYNVYPAEIEGFINEMPGVAESALIGVPHPDFGEVGVAVVIAKPGATINAERIIAELKSKLANFKIPKRCHVVPELPRNTMGKVQKNLLREQYKSAFLTH
jgi:acyl-CoA synthetase (AMP-forming)/AMP-acid ligase II